MTAIAQPVPAPSAARTPVSRSIIVGRVLSGMIALLLTLDGVFKIFPNKQVVEASLQLGYSPESMPAIGITLLACVALYVVPRTAVLGALLLTGYLGGAIATHVRVHDPLFSHVLFPTYVAAVAWGGLYLRNAKLRELVTGRR